MHKIDSNFCEFRFVPRSMDELGTTAAVVAVFRDLGLKERWSINQETLSRLALFFTLSTVPSVVCLVTTCPYLLYLMIET